MTIDRTSISSQALNLSQGRPLSEARQQPLPTPQETGNARPAMVDRLSISAKARQLLAESRHPAPLSPAATAVPQPEVPVSTSVTVTTQPPTAEDAPPAAGTGQRLSIKA